MWKRCANPAPNRTYTKCNGTNYTEYVANQLVANKAALLLPFLRSNSLFNTNYRPRLRSYDGKGPTDFRQP